MPTVHQREIDEVRTRAEFNEAHAVALREQATDADRRAADARAILATLSPAAP